MDIMYTQTHCRDACLQAVTSALRLACLSLCVGCVCVCVTQVDDYFRLGRDRKDVDFSVDEKIERAMARSW